MSEIVYDCRWSDQLDDAFIQDFLQTANAVFGGGFTKELFQKKYLDNIYGNSVVTVVYMDKKPVAARGLWRNDLHETVAYQPGDTCVTEVCRGKGIFTEMTKRSMELPPQDSLVYNFPNQNSYPGYIKMGWSLVKEYGIALFAGAKGYLNEHPSKMDKAYADWWLSEDSGFYAMKSGGESFLVKPMRKFCYRVVACVEEEVAERFPKMPLGICFYRSEKKTFYNKKLGLPLHVVSKENLDYIPIWKIDAI